MTTSERLRDRLLAQASLADPSAFPPGFRWGLSTAAYQIEGAVREDGRGPSIWDTFSHTPGKTFHGDNGDTACDHYHRWRQDLDLLQELAVQDYRLSLSWSRLQPAGSGPLNPLAVKFYRDLLSGLAERGVRPLVTLYHWDLPQPLEDAGGWPARSTAAAFADYVAAAVVALGDLVQDWITLNEPWCSSVLGYGLGAHAPGRRDLAAAATAAHHLGLAHGLALARIRQLAPASRVGISNIVTDLWPATDSPADQAATQRLDASSNRLFLDPLCHGVYSDPVHAVWPALAAAIRPGDLETIAAPTDFLGLNHYHRSYVHHDDTAPYLALRETPAEPADTSCGWSVVPDSLEAVLIRVARDYSAAPILVTESGASFDDYVDPDAAVVDQERVDYLRGYLDAAGRALRAGVDLRGYYAWSFLDNYEWALGYSKRFGLVHVDYASQRRIPKLSAHWYRREITQHRQMTASPAHPA
ncbi:MAG: beta-glucosidase [Propionibacteriaceae bacterium]|jgi:beta-glucosidase|nr:beta-glucosidase [Propionibacteriaceae bacterium]